MRRWGKYSRKKIGELNSLVEDYYLPESGRNRTIMNSFGDLYKVKTRRQ